MSVDNSVMEGEVVEKGLAVREDAQALVPAQEMTDLLARGAQQATIIADLLRKQKLVTRIGTGQYMREHIRFEGWVPIATANGKRLDTIEVHYEGKRGEADFTASACVGLRDIRSGEVVAKAWASCSRREPNWQKRDDYAIESMAQTRAGGKVCRMVYGWIISLAGFEATPAEEIPAEPKSEPNPERVRAVDQTAPIGPPPQPVSDESGLMTPTHRALIDDLRMKPNADLDAAKALLKSWKYTTWGSFLVHGTTQQANEIIAALTPASA